MLEKEIEQRVCKYAREKGCLTYKFTSPARASVPDRMFIAPEGKVFFIEFKRPKGKLTPGQMREITRLREYRIEVYTCYDVESGKLFIDEMV